MRILSTATAVPAFRLDRDLCRRYVEQVFAGSPARLRAARAILDRGRIEARHLAAPPEELLRPRSLTEKSAQYRRTSLALCEEVTRRALDRAHLRPEDVDQLVTTSCTGVMIPSVDAYLVERLGMRRDVERLPITELGCAGGAAALRQARTHQLAFPDHVSVVVACELPSLTINGAPGSMTELVAALLFGDGAAAVALGRHAHRPSPALLDARTHLLPESQALMGFDLEDGGLRLILDRSIPTRIKGEVRPLVDALLASHRLTLADIRFCAIHPGGRRILDDLDADLGLAGFTEPSWEVLRQYGNLSSATVLFVLEELALRPPPPAGAFGLLAAFGPGFSCELGLLRFDDDAAALS
jgi:alkylresorcinol/alkylpyrone synthase